MGQPSDRPPLPVADAAWADLPAPWGPVEVVEAVGSTNAEVGRRAELGAAEGLVVVAESQTAGRGRRDRTWTSPPRSGLTFSALLRPEVAPARLGWVPLLTGLAVADALSTATGVRVRLKWPNDVVVDEPTGLRKLGGILSEVHGSAVVVGVGLNVSTTAEELPVVGATSLLLEGARTVDRAALLREVLAELGARYSAWRETHGDAEASGLRAAYTVRCATVGRDVRVSLPGGDTLVGQAVGVDSDGCLRVVDATSAEVRTVAAGDVLHVR